jgi:signal-transduction protein with cAMP-binding, CBS, and nucleotidyltransferase domain
MAQDNKNSLAGIELLSELAVEDLVALEQRVRFRSYQAKELIFDLESGGTEVYFIVAGKV